MSIENLFERGIEYPIFVRGACVEEALLLLRVNKDTYKPTIDEICVFPIYEGFKKARIKPINRIPKCYNLLRMRDEATSWALANNEPPSLNFIYGEFDHFEEFSGRLGVVLYFSPKIIQLGYYRDPTSRPNELNAAVITMNNDFKPEYLSLVEPVGPVEYKILKDNLPKGRQLPKYRFLNKNEAIMWEIQNFDNIKTGKEGFNFP